MVAAYSKSGGVSGDDDGGGSSSVLSLSQLPPCPKYPPEYTDLYGKRRQTAKLQMLEREIGFLEEELKDVQTLQPASRSCKEFSDFLVEISDPLIPTKRTNRQACRGFWKWLCGMPCINLSWICSCFRSGCSPCRFKCSPCRSGCFDCLHLPSCCGCDICYCCSCYHCSTPNNESCSSCCSCSCTCSCSCPRSSCWKHIKPSSCTCRLPPRPDCSCCRLSCPNCCCWTWLCCCPKWTCSTAKCPKLHLCCNCSQTCHNLCCVFL